MKILIPPSEGKAKAKPELTRKQKAAAEAKKIKKDENLSDPGDADDDYEG